MKKLGLIGKKLGHSFSKEYFNNKFIQENVEGFQYDLYPIETIDLFLNIWKKNPQLIGLNITIPYKETIFPFLDELDPEAAKVGAVNKIKKLKNGKIKGYNTDVYGFEKSLMGVLVDARIDDALILGSGGASKAVAYVLNKLEIPFNIVSRSIGKGKISYHDLDDLTVKKSKLIVNTTPLGMYPHVKEAPNVNYSIISKGHYLYDLVYNPEVTLFLKNGYNRKAIIKNGLEMLHLQAEKAWEIWTEEV